MQTAIQLGQRQLSLHQILEHLTTSAFLPQYLGAAIVEETLAGWQQSPEYNLIRPQVESPELTGQIALRQPDDLVKLTATSPALALQTYKQTQWGHRIASYYLTRKTQLDRAIFSAIQVESIGLAQELYLRVKDRHQSFNKLARLYSQGSEAKLGGVMGPICLQQLHPSIGYHLASLNPGQLSPLFRLNNFHVFIRLEQLIPARFDDEMKQYLLDELFDSWLQKEVANRIASLSTISVRQVAGELVDPTPIIPVLDLGQVAALTEAPVADLNQEQSISMTESSTSFFFPSIASTRRE
jgi:parvulin-like peptidyl-prolyl isomerase